VVLVTGCTRVSFKLPIGSDHFETYVIIRTRVVSGFRCTLGSLGYAKCPRLDLISCEEFASKGCKVYATARRLEAMDGFRHEGIEKVRSINFKLRSKTDRHLHLQLILDINDDENMGRVVKTIIDAHGRIDIVVNNAGGICPGWLSRLVQSSLWTRLTLPFSGAILDVPLDKVRQTFETNVFAIVRMAQYVVPHMVKRGSGVIVNIGSLMGDL
jgi:1-acylglycerone phosphate reductase